MYSLYDNISGIHAVGLTVVVGADPVLLEKNGPRRCQLDQKDDNQKERGEDQQDRQGKADIKGPLDDPVFEET